MLKKSLLMLFLVLGLAGFQGTAFANTTITSLKADVQSAILTAKKNGQDVGKAVKQAIKDGIGKAKAAGLDTYKAAEAMGATAANTAGNQGLNVQTVMSSAAEGAMLGAQANNLKDVKMASSVGTGGKAAARGNSNVVMTDVTRGTSQGMRAGRAIRRAGTGDNVRRSEAFERRRIRRRARLRNNEDRFAFRRTSTSGPIRGVVTTTLSPVIQTNLNSP